MKSIAEFKRMLTIGSKWKTHWHPSNEYWGIRQVVSKDTVKVGFASHRNEGKVSYLDFPTSKYCRFENNSITILDHELKDRLTYKLVTEQDEDEV